MLPLIAILLLNSSLGDGRFHLDRPIRSAGLWCLSFSFSLADSGEQTGPRHPQWKVDALRLLKAMSPDNAEDLIEFWRPILQGFVLNLSDQQLITGLLLVILACIKYFNTDILSLGIANDLVLFSMITHFATILAIQEMLRDHAKLAVLRMVLVSMTFLLWLLIEITVSTRYWDSAAAIVPLFSILGIAWAFWGMCLSLFATDLALKARRAIGRQGTATTAQGQHIVEWIESHHQDHSLPRTLSEHTIFALRRTLSWLFEQYCRIYIATEYPPLKSFFWFVAEIFFPFRTGYVGACIQVFLFIIGISKLALDLAFSGLTSTWGFGQLLPTFMVFLPFFSLSEAYARESVLFI